MKDNRHRTPAPYWDTRIGLRERYPALQGLMGYATQQCDRFIFTDRRALLYDLVDLINTDAGKQIVVAWYKQSLHTLTLIQHIAENTVTYYDDQLVSITYHSLNIELERLMSQIVAALHPAAQPS